MCMHVGVYKSWYFKKSCMLCRQ